MNETDTSPAAVPARRSIAALQLPDLVPNAIAGAPPELLSVDPRSLFVDETYQRGLSERSVKLIHKIVTEWSWAAFKPPVVVRVDGRLDVIDGQHTAIAAVTHGSIELLPVLLVEAEHQQTRAESFVRHNRDRIQVTATQLHNAMVAAGDEDALTIDQVCKRAGVKILRNPPAMARFNPGETLAISTIRSLIRTRHAMGARKVLEVCRQVNAAPVTSNLIKAVDLLMNSQEYTSEIDAERIALVITSRGEELHQEAARFAAERKIPQWRAYASIIFMSRRRVRNG